MLSETHSTASKLTTYGVVALVVVLFALMVGALLFVAADKPHQAKALEGWYLLASEASATTQSTLLSSAASALEASMPTGAELGDIAVEDNDGDGIDYPLGALVCVLLIPLLGSGFLLVLYELPNVGAAYSPLLKRPD